MITKSKISTENLIGSIIHPGDRGADWLETDNYYQWYHAYGKLFKPKSILEFGLRFGYSMACIIKGCIDAGEPPLIASAIDGEIYNPGSNLVAKDNLLKLFGDYRIRFQVTTGDTTDPCVINRHLGYLGINKFDLIHLDASHTDDSIKAELDLVWDLLNEDGVIIIDDCLHAGGLYPPVNEWLFHKSKETRQAISQLSLHTFRGHMVIKKSFFLE